MRTNPRRTVMLKRQEEEEQSEVGGKLGNTCFTLFKGGKGLKRKNKKTQGCHLHDFPHRKLKDNFGQEY